MSEAERRREEERILGVLDEYREAMSEGTRHSRPKINAYKDLGNHFGRAGRRVFLATELCVLYPGKAAIVPDLLAVMDVQDPERERDTWRVVDEGRGIDLVLEFRNLGKKHKDLVDNVKDYARLGIAEYFSYDCRAKVLRGWRLPGPDAGSYRPLLPQGGMFASQVLGLDLAVADGRLRFFKDLAQIPTSVELVARLQRMTDAYQDQIEVLESALEEAESARQGAESARDDAVGRLQSARAGLAAELLRRLADRGLAVSDEQRARIDACDDIGRIVRWLERARAASSVEEALSA